MHVLKQVCTSYGTCVHLRAFVCDVRFSVACWPAYCLRVVGAAQHALRPQPEWPKPVCLQPLGLPRYAADVPPRLLSYSGPIRRWAEGTTRARAVTAAARAVAAAVVASMGAKAGDGPLVENCHKQVGNPRGISSGPLLMEVDQGVSELGARGSDVSRTSVLPLRRRLRWCATATAAPPPPPRRRRQLRSLRPADSPTAAATTAAGLPPPPPPSPQRPPPPFLRRRRHRLRHRHRLLATTVSAATASASAASPPPPPPPCLLCRRHRPRHRHHRLRRRHRS